MSIATQIERLQLAKSNMKTALEAKGVVVSASDSIDVYDDYISSISSDSGVYWNYTRPSDWPSIDDCGTNEVFLVVSDTELALAFATTIASSGTYSIDWGDGNIETDRVSGTTYQHQYVVGSGIPCSEGYTTFKVRIFNATNTITSWRIKRHTLSNRAQYTPLLDANIGAIGITTHDQMFIVSGAPYAYSNILRQAKISSFANSTSTLNMFNGCLALLSVTLPSTWGSIANASGMFSACVALLSVTLPSTWGSITNCANMFSACNSLVNIELPTSWGSITDCSYMFNFCYALQSLNLPTSWSSVSTCTYMLKDCSSLQHIELPTSWSGMSVSSCLFYGCKSLQSVTIPEVGRGNMASMFYGCSALKYVTPITSWGTTTNCSSFFSGCASLQTVTIPSTWPTAASSLGSMFSDCKQLMNITIPSSWLNITDVSYMFSNCYNLSYVVLPESWGSMTNCSNMFLNCYSLRSLTLGTRTNSMTNCTSMFSGCGTLSVINNLNDLGSTTSPTLFTTFMNNTELYDTEINLSALISQFACIGASGYLVRTNSIRLTNQASTFGGTSPQINIPYTSLPISALEVLFDDIPQGLSSKTINVTGVVSAATYARTVGTTSGSTLLTCAATGTAAVGQEIMGAGMSSTRAVTFQDSGDTVTLAAHGIPNGKKVSFSAITSTTGISINRIYYVINSTTNTFQLSLTEGGSAIALTTNGSGTMVCIPVIVSIVANTSITIDIPCTATATGVAATLSTLKRSKILLKGWTITG